MGYCLANHERTKPCVALMLGSQPTEVNPVVGRAIERRDSSRTAVRTECCPGYRGSRKVGNLQGCSGCVLEAPGLYTLAMVDNLTANQRQGTWPLSDLEAIERPRRRFDSDSSVTEFLGGGCVQPIYRESQTSFSERPSSRCSSTVAIGMGVPDAIGAPLPTRTTGR